MKNQAWNIRFGNVKQGRIGSRQGRLGAKQGRIGSLRSTLH